MLLENCVLINSHVNNKYIFIQFIHLWSWCQEFDNLVLVDWVISAIEHQFNCFHLHFAEDIHFINCLVFQSWSLSFCFLELSISSILNFDRLSRVCRIEYCLYCCDYFKHIHELLHQLKSNDMLRWCQSRTAWRDVHTTRVWSVWLHNL